MTDLVDHNPLNPLPTAADMDADGARLETTTDALRRAVRLHAGAINAARLLLLILRPVAAASGIPLGTTAVDLARVAIDIAAGERG